MALRGASSAASCRTRRAGPRTACRSALHARTWPSHGCTAASSVPSTWLVWLVWLPVTAGVFLIWASTAVASYEAGRQLVSMDKPVISISNEVWTPPPPFPATASSEHPARLESGTQRKVAKSDHPPMAIHFNCTLQLQTCRLSRVSGYATLSCRLDQCLGAQADPLIPPQVASWSPSARRAALPAPLRVSGRGQLTLACLPGSPLCLNALTEFHILAAGSHVVAKAVIVARVRWMAD